MKPIALLWILLLIVLVVVDVTGSPSSPSSSSSSSSGNANTNLSQRNVNSVALSSSSSSSASRMSSGMSSNGVVEILEEEYWNGEMWVGNVNGRWRNGNEKSLPPNELTAPLGWIFTSDWKIDVTGQSRDSLGWEYLASGTTRTRRWLRTIGTPPTATTSTITPTTKTTETTTTKVQATTTPANKVRRRSSSSTFLSWWNFKGYGCSIMKSFLRKRQIAFVVRTPLTTNLDWLERRPYLPTLTSSLALSYPLAMTSLSCNASIPVELLKYVFVTILDYIRYTISIGKYIIGQLFIYQIYQSLRTLYYLLLSKQNSSSSSSSSGIYTFPNRPYRRPFVTSSYISERIGVSVTWRHSSKFGHECVMHPWHSYLPTLEYTNRLVTEICWNTPQKIFQKLTSSNNNKPSSAPWLVSSWLRRYTASLGIFWGGPTPDPPFYTANCMFNLSGIYPKLILPSRNTNNANNNKSSRNNNRPQRLQSTSTTNTFEETSDQEDDEQLDSNNTNNNNNNNNNSLPTLTNDNNDNESKKIIR